MKISFSLPLILFLIPVFAAAGTQQNHESIKRIALEFAQAQTQTQQGKVDIKIDGIDPRLVLAPCNQIEAYLPSGAQLLGTTSIGVRCKDAKGGWSLFVLAHIRVSVTLWVAKHPLRQGQTLSADDLNPQEGELNQNSYITDEATAIGKVLKYSIAAGQPLKTEMLRSPFLVMQGQAISINVIGEGFRVRADGRALNNGAEGQTVQIRTDTGKVVSGIVQNDGSVEAHL
jgi:flagella basal body P-ring formation protein FlgA